MHNNGNLGYVALAIAILLVVLFGQIVAGNVTDIDNPLRSFFSVVAGGVGVMGLFWLAFRVLPIRYSRMIAVGVLAYSLTILVSDFLFPLSIGELVAGNEQAAADATSAAIQLGILALALGLVWSIPAAKLAPAAVLAAGVLVTSATLSVFDALPDADAQAAKHTAKQVAEMPNVYQFVFDQYHGPWLEFGMEGWGFGSELFAGFTYYPSATNNTQPTRVSFPSFLSGTLFDGSDTISNWLKRADRDNVISDLNGFGYATTVYAIQRRHGFRPADRWIKPEHEAAPLALLLDYWLLRAAPVVVRPYVLTNGIGPFSKSASRAAAEPTGDIRAYSSYKQFHQFLVDEANRPPTGQYVLVHIYPPHPPFQLDRHGQFVGESNYIEQLYLATDLMRQAVERLRELNRLDDSLVIIQSDHGHKSIVPGEGPGHNFTIDATTSAHIKKVDPLRLDGQRIEVMHSALLLIKPPKRCNVRAFRRDYALVELLALRSFTRDVVTSQICDYPHASEVTIINGLVKQYIAGKEAVLGTDVTSGTVSRYSVDKNFNWRVLEPVPFRF